MNFKDLTSRVKNVTLQDVKSLGKKTARLAADGICVSTAIVVVSSPIQAFADTIMAEAIGLECYVTNTNLLNLNNLMAMTDARSFASKIGMAELMYGVAGIGFGLAYGRLRDKSKEFFGLHDKSKESLQKLHDFFFTLTYSSSMLIGSYLIGGEHDPTKIGTALFIAGITQPIRGPYIGKFTDYYRDLLGIKECNRITYPKAIKNLGKKAKLGVAALGVATSLGLLGAIYGLTPVEWNNSKSDRLAERKQAEANFRYEEPSNRNQPPFQIYSQSSRLEEMIK